jgi:transcriptional regulator with XRE-family HTH domain
MPKQPVVKLPPENRAELMKVANSRTFPAGDVFRARLVLALGAGHSYETVARDLRTSAPTIARWKRRFDEHGMDGLIPRHRGSPARVATAAVQARVLKKLQQAPPDGSTHWSCRKMAETLGLSKSTVQRIWASARLKPHRLERYMASPDPDFESKAADILGLYLNPPQHAALFCVDEKTAIQALDRKDPRLPLSPGRAERQGFEYYRHGTLSLYAALNVKNGKVEGRTVARHTSSEFVNFRSGASRPLGSRNSRDSGQSLGAQNRRRRSFPERESQGEISFHADLLLLAQPGGDLVCQDPAPGDRSRHFHFRGRPEP